jgi:hypothetical protein
MPLYADLGQWYTLSPYAKPGSVGFCLDYLKCCIKIIFILIIKFFDILLNFTLEAVLYSLHPSHYSGFICHTTLIIFNYAQIDLMLTIL